MHFDALTLACVADELGGLLVSGRVQQVVLVDEHSIGLEIYAGGARHQLLIAADPARPRVHTVSYRLRRGVERATPLLLLLRKYVRNAIVMTVVHPDPTERLLRLAFSHHGHGETTLLVELIGRQSNVLLLDRTGKVLECMHRVSNPLRHVTPGRPYVLPVPQQKLAPLDDETPDYYAQLVQRMQAPGKLWKVLVDGIAGLSPTAAREVAWRATGSPEASTVDVPTPALVQALQSLWLPVRTGAWVPGVVAEGDHVVGFAPYHLHFRGTFVPTDGISAALERYYGAAPTTAPVPIDPYAAQRAAIASLLHRAQARIQRQLAALEQDEPFPGEPALVRREAEWLLALSGQVTTEQTVLEVDLGEERLRIALDPSRTPIEQAEQLFKRARKLERAAAFIPQRRAELEQDLSFLDQLALDLKEAVDQPEIAAVRTALRQTGLVRDADPKASAAPPTPKRGPLRFRSAQGLEIVVGRNARQNEAVTFHLARGDDLWLHVRGAPGAHVVIRTAGQIPDASTLRAAAQLAAFHSNARNEAKASVICVQRRQVSRAPGRRPGQVLVRNEAVITVPGTVPDDVVVVEDG